MSEVPGDRTDEAYAHGMSAGRRGDPPTPPGALTPGSYEYQSWISGHRRGANIKTRTSGSGVQRRERPLAKKLPRPLTVEVFDGEELVDSWDAHHMRELSDVLADLIFGGDSKHDGLKAGREVRIREAD